MKHLRIAVLAAIGLAACAGPRAIAPTGKTLAAFERALAAQDSATAALTGWCRERKIADPALVTAQRLKSEMAVPGEAMRRLLAVGPDEPLRYRHVQLRCGDTVLSIAQNWYVPARLTPDMNRQLDSSDAPFGRVAAPLRFTRQRLASQRGQADDCPQGTILSQRAVLNLPDGRPLSAVAECYTKANLAAPR